MQRRGALKRALLQPRALPPTSAPSWQGQRQRMPAGRATARLTTSLQRHGPLAPVAVPRGALYVVPARRLGVDPVVGAVGTEAVRPREVQRQLHGLGGPSLISGTFGPRRQSGQRLRLRLAAGVCGVRPVEDRVGVGGQQRWGAGLAVAPVLKEVALLLPAQDAAPLHAAPGTRPASSVGLALLPKLDQEMLRNPEKCLLRSEQLCLQVVGLLLLITPRDA
mmetsp:Transcript_68881/g.204988  ORF Transcript_68881/g.204988 Transcript_68881/m.204988 type:complete len:221 (-) Transcript_68881:98-760(-)